MVFAEIIKALASLGWVVFAFVALFLFRNEIKSAILRVKKGKLLGQEVELSESLDQLKISVRQAEIEVIPPPDKGASLEVPESRASEERIIAAAAESPRAALLLLSTELDRTVAEIFARSGRHQGRRRIPLAEGIRELQEHSLPPSIRGSLDLFFTIRNKIVHVRGGVSDEDIFRAIDSGLVLLRALKSIPLEQNIVHHPGVEIFSDAECRTRYPEGRGVILETLSPGGASKTFRIFPTLKADYVKGKMVSWEWNLGRTWGEAWYRDPETGEIKRAWSESAEFQGRHIDELD